MAAPRTRRCPQVMLTSGIPALDAPAEVDRIAASMRQALASDLRRRGFVVGLSGGIDSSVAAALAVAAVGPKRVLGVLMPEAESSADSLRLGRMLAEWLGIEYVLEDITATLNTLGCYELRDEAIRSVVPEYGVGYRCQLVWPPIGGDRYRITEVVVKAPDGTTRRARLTADAYGQIVAATNFKQRIRKMLEYAHADRLHYAVVGTPNRLEYDQGCFVKNGDGAADINPLAHLYKGQVYQLARAFGVPQEICDHLPTTDTFLLSHTQEESFFSVPYNVLDLCLYARDHGLAADSVSAATGLTREQIVAVFTDIDAKRRLAVYLHMAPVCLERSATRYASAGDHTHRRDDRDGPALVHAATSA
jgi:NAD+ synthase